MSTQKTTGFNSEFKSLGKLTLPAFSGTRVMMMPVILGDINSIPQELNHYKDLLKNMNII
jgi:hypothetical protein